MRLPGLRARLTLIIGAGTVAVVAGLLYLGAEAVNETEESAGRERLDDTSQAMAAHVDDVVKRTVGREIHLARMVANAWSQGETELNNLLDAYPRLLFESDLYLVRPEGDLVWSMRPGVAIPGGVTAEPLVTRSAGSRKTMVGSCDRSTSTEPSMACFASPVLVEREEVEGVLLAQIDLNRPDIDLFSLEALNEEFNVKLVDAGGVVIAVNNAGAGVPGAASDTRASPSDDAEASTMSAERIGYASVTSVPGWGVVVEPKNPGALALGTDAKRRLLITGAAALVIALGLAWLTARQVLRPLLVAVERAQRVAAGDLNLPTEIPQGDELGDLSRAIESLRISLKDAVAEAHEKRRSEEARGHLLDGLLARQERERYRIARELHEGTAQSLSALALRLDLLQGELPEANDALRDRLSHTRALALALIEDLKRLAVEIRPPLLTDLGLPSAVRSYAERRLSPCGVRVGLESHSMEERLPGSLETSLYRVAEEAINNIAVHAGATSVKLSLERDRGWVTFIAEDNGRGFQPAEVLADPNAVRGLGILGMRERVALLGGTFKIESTPGQGTRVCAEVPIQSEEERQS